MNKSRNDFLMLIIIVVCFFVLAALMVPLRNEIVSIRK